VHVEWPGAQSAGLFDFVLTSDFNFDLPDALIAQAPSAERGGSRLMVVDRSTGGIAHRVFADLPSLLMPGDVLVVNDTRVFPARLIGRRLPGGGAAECFLVRPAADPDLSVDSSAVGLTELEATAPVDTWIALVHPGQRLREGSRMVFEAHGRRLNAEIIGRHYHGRRTVRLWTEDGSPVRETVDAIGHVPLPPYIKRPDATADRNRYQTVYARERGSIAAPTAGLHFTPMLLDELKARGIEQISITLHVGYGTFQPIRVDRVEEHEMESEHYEVTEAAAAALSKAKKEMRRVIAVGTTTTRTLESLSISSHGLVSAGNGDTGLFIRPGHEFRIVSGLITNFHLPQSSLLMLVSAFGGQEQVLAAYREAVKSRYRFYSYGDAMLIT
jgi:S-adenosylmethionine:tRNA ribosyltransferase-isomerase